MWNLSGIYRSVYLLSKPKTHLSDIRVTATLDEHYAEGMLEVEVICNQVCRGEVELALNDASGATVLSHQHALAPTSSTSRVATNQARAKLKVPSVQAWSAETPNLYRLVVSLFDEHGEFVECEASDIGFRSVSCRRATLA